ncbi:craniofacial development protein 2-like [Aplysia californica]|uniref:Craniofacial development protein 2-like n=1 Tax=Aplysia californica TaxID=6500 RepID=A0ABM0JEJ3_APLCA|nr:craniofacial development protein 2-like [Aplysia californica]
MPDRSTGRGQTKRDPPTLQVSEVQLRANNPDWYKAYVTETATKRHHISVCDGPSESLGTRMNAGSESRKEAVCRKMEDLNTAKTKVIIGLWNVRTMYETGELAQVTTEMRRYGLHILGISESHWTGSGRLRTATGETLIYFGREDSQKREGVAIILKKGLEKCLMEWKQVNSRMMTLRLKGKHSNTSILQCYAPTNDSEDESKDYFYEQLQRELTGIPRHDLIVVMGDLNAKVGEDNTNYERKMGQQGTGTRNENGERLVDFCALNNLVIGGTLFPHRTIHKLAWDSPNGRDKNQIDHLMIGGMWRRSLQDVKVKRGADVGSDHHLVTARIKLKLKKTFTKEATRTRFNVHKLSDGNVRSAFRLELKNRFQALQDLEETPPPIQMKSIPNGSILLRPTQKAVRHVLVSRKRMQTKNGYSKELGILLKNEEKSRKDSLQLNQYGYKRSTQRIARKTGQEGQKRNHGNVGN